MATAVQCLPDGHSINEYRIDKLVGVGGFGLTYLATDKNLNLPVAIKEYFPSDIAERHGAVGNEISTTIRPSREENRETFEWGLARFLDEARTLATFRHANIVRVMRFFEANATAYMVMEFVQGAPLSEWVKSRRPLTQAAIEKIALPLIDGLGVIHATSYLHRDVKPANIYIRQDGSPVLLDFGSARSTNSGKDLTAIVSPGYAPVEQYSESSSQGPWTDLYAIGGVMYWMVTGKKPVDATARLKNDPQPRALDVGDRNLYTARLLAAIDWALMPDEQQRPLSSGELLARLNGEPASDAGEITLPLSAPGMAGSSYTKTIPSPLPAPSSSEATQIADSQPVSVPLDSTRLKVVEVALAKAIGPLAAVLVRKAAKKSTSIEAVIATVIEEIDDEHDREVFVRRMKENTQPPSQPPSATMRTDRMDVPTQLAAARFDIEILARAERRLAQHIGAIARVIVKKAAMKARDEAELYLIIADEIDDPNDRKAFIKKAISASNKD